MQLIFCKSHNLTSKIISAATFSKWSHIEFYFGPTVIGSSGHYGGVAEHSTQWLLSSLDYYEICSIEVPRADLAEEFVRAQLGKKYDYSALYALPFIDRDWSTPDKWFCSELVAAALEVGGVNMFRRTPVNRVTPAMIYTSPLLT
jgi:hypothetical protein